MGMNHGDNGIGPFIFQVMSISVTLFTVACGLIETLHFVSDECTFVHEDFKEMDKKGEPIELHLWGDHSYGKEECWEFYQPLQMLSIITMPWILAEYVLRTYSYPNPLFYAIS